MFPCLQSLRGLHMALAKALLATLAEIAPSVILGFNDKYSRAVQENTLAKTILLAAIFLSR